MAREICADCNREPDVCECPREGDQRARFPVQLRLYRVGAYVEFDVWAGDERDAYDIIGNLGIPIEPGSSRPLNMAGRVGHATHAQRVTADAVRLRCLNVNETREEA